MSWNVPTVDYMAGRDSLLKLNDKTVAIIGTFSSMTQVILSQLTEQGADVAFVGKDVPEARRYCEHINDQREVYSHYGRAGVINADLTKPQDAPDLIGRVVHSFGRLDSLVDTLPIFRQDLEMSEALAEECVKFLTSRPRSRIMWLTAHPQLEPDLNVQQTVAGWRKKYSSEYGQKNLTANELVVGISDEYLLRRSPQNSSIKKTFEELKTTLKQARIVESGEIASWVMFLASPLSQAVNGQRLFIDHALQG